MMGEIIVTFGYGLLLALWVIVGALIGCSIAIAAIYAVGDFRRRGRCWWLSVAWLLCAIMGLGVLARL